MRAAAATLLLVVSACSAPGPTLLATYRAPTIPAECEQAVYNDPEVHRIMLANIASPTLIGENQDKLAFAQEEAVRNCLRAKGLLPAGGVEPVRYRWYPSPL
jgi:hypothetical protein